MKSIMYHYVQRFEKSLPNFRFLSVENFKKQLDFFEKNFGFLERNEWNYILKNNCVGKFKDKIILTFDDALKCHYEYVYPELKKRGLWGIFYIPTEPYKTNNLLDVHRIHLLCGAYQGKDLLKVLKYLVDEEMIPDKKIKEFRKETYLTQNNFEGVSEFKRILNYYISYKFRSFLIDKIAGEFGYEFDVKKFYISKKELKEMSQNGHLMGSHTVTHPVMSKLTLKDQYSQIKESFLFLKKIGVLDEKTYCHPYGGFHSFNQNTINILNNENINFSFNVESRDINDNDLVNCRHFLPRYDCNEFPFGKAS